MKKSIALIHGPLVIGGAEKALINMLQYIDYYKYEVTLWLKDDTGVMEDQVNPNVIIRYWGEHLSQSYSQFIKKLLMQGNVLGILRSVFFRVLSRVYVHDWYKNYKYYLLSLSPLSKKKYDVAISYHSLVREDLMVLDFAVKAKKKIGWIHGACRHDTANTYYKPYSIEYSKLDYIFCVSNSVRHIFLAKYPKLESKTEVMYDLLNFDEIRRLAQENVKESFEGISIVTVGRLSPEKGQNMIPEIAQKILERGIHFIWYIIGDGELRETIETDIRKKKLYETVVLLGAKINPYPYIQRCSIYVQTSYSEGFCITAYEAQVLNKLQVVTDVPVIRELFIDGEAIICRPTVDDLTRGILETINKLSEKKQSLRSISDSYNQTELEKLYKIIGE